MRGEVLENESREKRSDSRADLHSCSHQKEAARRALLGLLAIALSVTVSGCQRSSPAVTVDHVLLISIDSLRADRLGASGYDRPTSPALDELAGRGTSFTTCVATSPWTPPSHTSMLTGLYPARHGIYHSRDDMRAGVKPLAALLRARGFQTAAIIAADLVLPCNACRDAFDSVEYFSWRGDSKSGPEIVDRGKSVTSAAINWLSKHSSERFFLFVHYYDVHCDYSPDAEYARLLGADPHRLEVGKTSYLTRRRLPESRAKMPVSAADLKQISRLYDAEIRQLNAQLERLFRHLRTAKLEDRTLVIVTADHGDEFLEHGGFLHGKTMYEELLHVPLLVAGPGIPRGRRVDAVVSLVDIAPTILDATGRPSRAEMDGRSLLPLLEGSSDWQEQVGAQASHRRTKKMARDGNFKLIADRSGREELYDLEHDPGERFNLIDRRPEVRARLKHLMSELLEDADRSPDATPTLSEEYKERLRILGYLD